MRDKVSDLQSKLSHAAKQSLDRRFGALYDKIYREDVVREAWKRVAANRGAPGVDKQDFEYIEEVIGVDQFLAKVCEQLKSEQYRPQPNVSYATYFNRKGGRDGHLFQGRFKAILIDADEYLKHLSRYIHLNPVRAKNGVSSVGIYMEQLFCFYWQDPGSAVSRKLKKLRPRVPLEMGANAVCEEFDCNEEQILTKGRKKNKAREVLIFIARDMTGITCKDLGEYFSGVSGALITMMYNRIADESKRNKRLKGRINNIRNQIFKI